MNSSVQPYKFITNPGDIDKNTIGNNPYNYPKASPSLTESDDLPGQSFKASKK